MWCWYLVPEPTSVPGAVHSTWCWVLVPCAQYHRRSALCGTSAGCQCLVAPVVPSTRGSAVPGVWCWCPIPDTVSGVTFLKQCGVSVPGSWCVPDVGTRYQCSMLCSVPNTAPHFLRLVPTVNAQFPVSVPHDRGWCAVAPPRLCSRYPVSVLNTSAQALVAVFDVSAQCQCPGPRACAQCWYSVPGSWRSGRSRHRYPV